MDDPPSFAVFRDFMVEEAIHNSPELQQLRAAIEASEHQINGLRNALYAPDVFVTAGFNHVFRRAGSGSQDAAPIPGVDLPPRDDFVWQVGAGLQFRLFDMSRYPEIERNEIAVGQLEIQRRATRQAIETGVRAALHQAGASRASVRLRAEAAEAAEQNLALVADAYRRGVVTIVTLLDAQNQARLTQLNAANAVYNFMADFIRVERAAGAFSLQLSDDEREAWFDRLQRFATEHRRTPTRPATEEAQP